MDYFTASLTTVFLLLSSASCLDRPEQVHLSYGATADQMVVMWSTMDNVTCSVHYGEAHDQLTGQQAGNVTKLTQFNQQAKQFVHRATLQNLKPKTRYYYKVVSYDDTRTMATVLFSFKTQDPNTNRSASFLVYGDLGLQAGQSFHRLQEEVKSGRYDAIWHVGDYAYDMDSDGGLVGDKFMKALENISANIPYMVAPGNHEISQQFTQYRTRFSTPGQPWPIPLDQMWYSYNVGPIHFISYSTEVYFTYNQDYVCKQFDWLLQDLTLANENRNSQPWIIAMGHRPMYCSNNDADDCSGFIFRGWVVRGLEELFHAQGVDLVIEAHEHSYERLYPMYHDKVVSFNYTDVNASVHLISGAAGNQEGNDGMQSHAKAWSAFRHSINGDNTYGHLTVHNSSHLYWDQVRVVSGEVIDSIWVIKNYHGPFVSGINCTGPNRHPSCNCPPPFRYVTVFACVGVAFVTVLGALITCCFLWRRHRKSKAQNSIRYLLLNSHQEDVEQII